jgi:hypothetical protein
MNEANRADYIDRAAKRLIVCTPSGTFEGTFHFPIAARLSDALRTAFTTEHHFLLTDVTISGKSPLAGPASRAEFICINGAHVDVVIPVEEPTAAEANDTPDPPRRLLKDFAA